MKERLKNLWVSLCWFFRPPKGVYLVAGDANDDGTFFTWEQLEEIGYERAWEIAREEAEFRQHLRWWFHEVQCGLVRPPPLRMAFVRPEPGR